MIMMYTKFPTSLYRNIRMMNTREINIQVHVKRNISNNSDTYSEHSSPEVN